MNKVKARKDLTGMVFGRLVVLEQADDYIEPNGAHKAKWLVQCSCWSEPFSVLQKHLKSGHTTSCGCYRHKVNIKHGMRWTGGNKSWRAMIQRCTNPNDIKYPNYGGRGISVCDRWLHSFRNFYEDMGDRPEGTSLDRTDVNGNYEPSNCRWATGSEQAYNRRKAKNNTSGRTGVCWIKTKEMWNATIMKEGRQVNLGLFKSFEDATEAREAAELELFGYTKE